MAELLLSLFELAEAEGRLFSAGIRRLGSGCLWAAIGIFLIGGSLALLLASLYSWMLFYMPRPLALLILGFVCLGLGLMMLLLARPHRKRHEDAREKDGLSRE